MFHELQHIFNYIIANVIKIYVHIQFNSTQNYRAYKRADILKA